MAGQMVDNFFVTSLYPCDFLVPLTNVFFFPNRCGLGEYLIYKSWYYTRYYTRGCHVTYNLMLLWSYVRNEKNPS